MRISGMATGLDTDTLVKQMMKPYTMKVDKMKQDMQIVAWRQELYRDIMADTDTIKNTYFDLLKPDTNMLSKGNYAGFDVTVASIVSGESANVSASASVGAKTGNYKVEVTKLATLASSAMSIGDVNIESGLGTTLAAGSITLQYKDSNDAIQTKTINTTAITTAKQLMETITKDTAGAINLSYSELTKKFTLKASKTGVNSLLDVTGSKDVLNKLGFTSGTGTDPLTLTPVSGKDAVNGEVYITPPDGPRTLVEKTSNTFSIDGINYNLTKTGTSDVTVVANSQKTFDKILSFIDKYNELVGKVSEKIDEKKQYKYLPLTDEQREAMKEDEIKQWETRAKVGLLKGDSNLENMLNTMRKAFYEEVKVSGISLSEIGLSTSKDISQRGKIIIDEVKLKAAIETRGEQVADLFTKQSTTHPSYNPDYTSGQRDVRNKEEGIFQRISDILQDYTRTTRNANGKKGIFLEKAGMKGDLTEFKSLLSEDIIKKDAKISEMIKNLATRENRYYLQFSKLETAMNKINSQSSWLAQQLGGGQ